MFVFPKFQTPNMYMTTPVMKVNEFLPPALGEEQRGGRKKKEEEGRGRKRKEEEGRGRKRKEEA